MTDGVTPGERPGADELDPELEVLRAAPDPEDAEEGDTTAIRAVRAEPAPDDDETVLVADASPASFAAGEPEDDDSTTNPMGHHEPDDDSTAIIGESRRAAAAESRQDGVAGGGAEAPPDPAPPAAVAIKPAMVVPAKRRRRTLRPAPVPPGYGGRALLAPGTGAVSTYRVREIPRPPASVQPLATRPVDRLTGGIASVSKRSRRLSVLAMGGFALSIVVSVTGLVLIARSVILGY